MATPVFISWSGKFANDVAKALKQLLGDVLNGLDIFVSSEDIEAGTRWNDEIKAHVRAAQVGIIVVTKDKLESRWLNFEAGAMAFAWGDKKVIPYCVDLEVGSLGSPMNQLQAVRADRVGTKALVESVNNALGDNKTEQGKLDRLFGRAFEDLERSIMEATYEEEKRTEKPVKVQEPTPGELFKVIDEKMERILARGEQSFPFQFVRAMGNRWLIKTGQGHMMTIPTPPMSSFSVPQAGDNWVKFMQERHDLTGAENVVRKMVFEAVTGHPRLAALGGGVEPENIAFEAMDLLVDDENIRSVGLEASIARHVGDVINGYLAKKFMPDS